MCPTCMLMGAASPRWTKHTATPLPPAGQRQGTPSLVISQVTFRERSTVDSQVLIAGGRSWVIMPLCGNGITIGMNTSFLLNTLTWLLSWLPIAYRSGAAVAPCLAALVKPAYHSRQHHSPILWSLSHLLQSVVVLQLLSGLINQVLR